MFYDDAGARVRRTWASVPPAPATIVTTASFSACGSERRCRRSHAPTFTCSPSMISADMAMISSSAPPWGMWTAGDASGAISASNFSVLLSFNAIKCHPEMA